MRQPVKQSVRDVYLSESLSAKQMAALQAKLGSQAHPRRHGWRSLSAAAAAVFAVGALVGVLLLRIADPNLTPPARIAQEVASNHVAATYSAPDVTGSTLVELQPVFSRLSFQLIEPANASGDLILEGGRFCAILAVPAAQLRYRSTEGRAVTLYQVPYDPRIHGNLPAVERGEVPIQLVSRGVDVRIWTERGLVIATASTR